VTALSDSDENVRYFAADALGDVRTAEVTQAIEARLAAETSPVVRSALMAAKNKLDRPRRAVDQQDAAPGWADRFPVRRGGAGHQVFARLRAGDP